MPPHAPTDRPAPGSPVAGPGGPGGAVDELISQARRLRGDMDTVRTAAPEAAQDDVRARWQRALCELAMHHLDDLDDHLAQLRAGAPTPPTAPAATPVPPAPSSVTAGQAPAASHPHRVGSAEWNLLTDEVSWSGAWYAIVGRDPAEPPPTLDELPSLVHPEDQPGLTSMVTDCLIDGKPIDGEFRITRPDGTGRTVHMMGEPVLDADGSTASMWAVLRDVSELRRGQRALSETRASLGRQDSARQEHRLAVELQEAVLPPWRGPLRFPHDEAAARVRPAAGPLTLDIAALRLPATGREPGGGHWHEAAELPDGQSLLAVGELAGHGVARTADTAALLGALRGTALTGAAPDTLLGWLNQLVGAGSRPALAGALCCRFDPGSGDITWAQAGHPAPLLFRDGTGHELRRPEGPLLGASATARYARATRTLQPGDLLLLRTGSAVPEPGTPDPLQDLAGALAQARTAQECADLVAGTPAVGAREHDGCVLLARVSAQAPLGPAAQPSSPGSAERP